MMTKRTRTERRQGRSICQAACSCRRCFLCSVNYSVEGLRSVFLTWATHPGFAKRKRRPVNLQLTLQTSYKHNRMNPPRAMTQASLLVYTITDPAAGTVPRSHHSIARAASNEADSSSSSRSSTGGSGGNGPRRSFSTTLVVNNGDEGADANESSSSSSSSAPWPESVDGEVGAFDLIGMIERAGAGGWAGREGVEAVWDRARGVDGTARYGRD